MKLKAKKKTEPRSTDVCQASRCKEDPALSFAPGVRFPIEEGEVVLCDKHNKMSEPPMDDTKALVNILNGGGPPPEPAPAPVFEGIQPTYVPGPADGVVETRLAAEADEAKEILAMVEQFQIVTQEDMEFANECLGEVKTKLKELKEEREGVTKPMNAALKKVRGWFKPAETFYGHAEKAWKDRIAAWTLAQAEAQRRALEAVQAASAAGDVGAVAQAMTLASAATAELPGNVSVQERWVVEITDNYAVPPDYWSPDINKIREAVGGGIREIPGCRIYRDDIVTRRGA